MEFLVANDVTDNYVLEVSYGLGSCICQRADDLYLLVVGNWYFALRMSKETQQLR